MDRRTQLAFLLIAVIMGLNLLLVKPQEKPPADMSDSLRAERAPIELETPAAPAPTDGSASTGGAQAPSTAANHPFPTASASETVVVVETPLQKISISRAGALITEISLQNFELAKGGPVDLVAEEFSSSSGLSALGLTLRTPTGTFDLDTARFELLEALPASGTIRLEPGSDPRTLTFRTAVPEGGAIVKRFTIDPERYDITLDLEIERGGPLQQVENFSLSWTRPLPVTEANEKDDLSSFQLLARTGEELTRKGLRGGFFGGGSKGEQSTSVAGEIGWTCMKSKYFMVALVPETQKSGTALLRSHSDLKWMGMEITHPAPWRAATRETYRIYAGPISYDLLKEQGAGLEAAVELGYRWIRPFSWAILAFMQFLHRFIANYGVIILIISLLTKLIFWPLSEKSFRSMREMQAVQPLMQEIRTRYKDDPQEMNRQVMALYKQHGVNPLGGCMPLLVQMPIFFALYSVLRSNIELRNAPFMLWIDNLAAPDVLFHLPFKLPLLGTSNFSLLPLLMGVGMIWQTKMGSTMTMSGPAAQQQAIMKWVMPIMFIFIFYSMPSGLVLYWLINTVASVAQQMQINRKYAVAPAASPAVAPPPETTERKDNGAPDRDNRGERRRGSRARSRRVEGKSR